MPIHYVTEVNNADSGGSGRGSGGISVSMNTMEMVAMVDVID